MTHAVSVYNLSKYYKLGVIGRQTLVEEFQYWWHRFRGRDPLQHMKRIGHTATEARRVAAENEGMDRFWALKNLTFDIRPGEIVGIIGRNGAGKSTLLKILNRITEPTSGEAIINGRIASLLEVGTGFHPELTGRENVYMNGTILGMKKREIDRKFDEIVDFAEIGQFLDTPVKRYSSGMHVRLAFAVAAHLEPDILLIDEVLAVGDAQFQKKCLGKMQEVSEKDGRTILFVSHNMSAITRLCTRSLLLDAGQIAKDDSPEEVVKFYLTKTAEMESTREWQEDVAPGTDDIKLLGITIQKRDGSPVTIADVTDELEVTLTYHVHKPLLKFRCLLWFSTCGTIAFASVEPFEHIHECIGVYVSSVIIPANLLSENEYTVSVSIFSSHGVKMHYIQARDVLSFQVVDPMFGNSARGDYTEGLAGVIRPFLAWKMDKKLPGECSR